KFSHLEDGLMTAFSLEQADGDIFFENLAAVENRNAPNRIVVPICINNNTHWIFLTITHDMENRENPQIHYFDPFGGNMPDLLMGILRRQYPQLSNDHIHVSRTRYQDDSYNCGPWIVA